MNTFDKLPTSITFDYLQSIKRTWLNDLLIVGAGIGTKEILKAFTQEPDPMLMTGHHKTNREK